jgi:quercetin dioxygenase-like cupin family protein
VSGRVVRLADVSAIELAPGDAFQIPWGVEHAARSEVGCIVMDVVQPVREDYHERAQA